MTILADYDIHELMRDGLLIHSVTNAVPFEQINPASVDVSIGGTAIVERGYGHKEEVQIHQEGLTVEPGEMLLVGTDEVISVPNGYVVDLRLKSTSARLGWDHNAALWVDPGFRGIITLELRNCNRYTPLILKRGQRIAQAVVHRMTRLASKPYNGRYQNATGVEGPK